jgi:hypothetical protein
VLLAGRVLGVVLAAGLAASISPGARAQPGAGESLVRAAGKSDSLDIRRITLYRSGVGSFQRGGKVEGDATIALRFKTEQINDILKSMVVLDLSGGTIEGVSYASKEPLARRLASFGVDISGDPSLPALLAKLRGATASVTTTEGSVSGTILGVETRKVAAGKDVPPVDTPFVNLVTGTGIRSFDLTRVSNVELQDKDLAGELAKALAALAEHRADRTKAVEVKLRGQGSRDVVVNYIHEMPVWKASYRLVLPDEKSSDKASHSLQGWAIVENPTDEDWNDVRLSLVSGRPVSFQMDLYEPLFVLRPEIPVPTVPGVMPRMYSPGEQETAKAGAPVTAGAPAPSARPPARARGGGGLAPGSPAEGGVPENAAYMGVMDAAAMADYSARAQAQAVESGEVFQYELATPVTIARQRSAMLPIINQGVGGRRVSIFNRADGSEHPMRGVELTNSTNLQLLPGPISVYDGSAYAGDAQIGHVSPGEKRLLAYAIDLDVSVVMEDQSSGGVRKLRIVSGMIEQTSLARSQVVYKINGKSSKIDRTVLIEHPKLPGYELKEGKPVEEALSLYRFEVPLGAGKSESLKVVQEQTFSQQIALTDIDLPTILAYQTQGKASKAVVDAFREGQKKRAEIAELQRQIEAIDRERAEIDKDQARVRENMRTIERDTDLYRSYIKQFTDQETRLKELSTQAKSVREQIEARRQAFSQWVTNLNVE